MVHATKKKKEEEEEEEEEEEKEGQLWVYLKMGYTPNIAI